jgi:hypothetical protein
VAKSRRLDDTMSPATLRYPMLLLAALGLAPGAAHVLELPVKMQYSPELYTAVTSTLYAFFGSVGSTIQVAAVVFAGWRAWLVRHTPTFRLALLGFLFLALSLMLWGALVAPVNSEWADALNAAPQSAATVYAKLRPRWEYGHVAAFAAWLAGYCVLQLSVFRESSRAAWPR